MNSEPSSPVVKPITTKQWIRRLNLSPHPEGGHYAETFRSARHVTPQNEPTSRELSSAIHYLLGSASIGQFSAWHRLQGLEESWYYHYGDDLLIHVIDQSGALSTHTLGTGPQTQLQVHIPADVWFCAVVADPSPQAYSLVSCAVQPGFDFTNFELADGDALSAAYPQHRDIVLRYCRQR